ncbi:MAG: thioredoxin-dependent thiol peroxidase [Flavobacteriales bacterium]|nr:thioredoxin-dependent thiol peroxidase [Flavobacteriales bacterium]|tara:strand:+ start:8154 stop:8612 length:459 start_codon:yes stop_codon:yes gene_type:complete
MTTLKQGDKAPEFNALDEYEQSVSLTDFLGKKVILYFYPKDMTPGCTIESCNLRENHDLLISKGFVVLGVSPDSSQSHQKFIGKYDLPFQLIADVKKELIEAYGVWGPKKFMGKKYDGVHRTTFVISEDGHIERVFDKVKTKDHAKQILDSY